MSAFRTSPPSTYIAPSREEIVGKAKEMKVSKFSTEMVQDLCNLAAGGNINPPSSYRELVRESVEENIERKRISGCINGYQIDGKEIKSRSEAIDVVTDKTMKYHRNVCDFLQTVEIDKFPGNSPLEQALSMLQMLFQKSQSGESGDNSEPLPIFTENDNSEKEAKDLNNTMDQVNSLSQDEKDLLDPENTDSDSKSEGEDDNLQKRKLAMDFVNGKQVMLEVARNLNNLSRMQVRKSKKQEPDPDGSDVRNRPIRHLGEMHKLVKSEWALPEKYRLFRMVTNASQVRERVTTIEKKQLLYIIVDCSGSMEQGQRIYKAGGIIMNRLQAVIAGEAEVYIRLFDTQLKTEHHASNAIEARETIKHFTEKNYSGGSTDISGCAKAAQTRIEEIIKSGSMYKPELVIITDGEDQISLKAKDFAGSKIHAFVIECENKQLTDLAKSTGGVGIDNL